MAIGKKATKKDVEQFIENTADKQVTKKAQDKIKRVQFSHTTTPEMLEQIDAKAAEIGLTRAGLVNLFISMGLKRELWKQSIRV